MEGFVDKIVEKYSEDLVRLFPIQKLFSMLIVALIFYMTKHGEYISSLESVLNLSLKDLIDSDGQLLKITLGTITLSLALISLASFTQGKIAKRISRFIANGYNLDNLSNKLHFASKQLKIPPEIAAELANEHTERLERKKSNLAKISSFSEFLFIIASAEITAAIYGINFIDLTFSIIILLAWTVIRVKLIFMFIGEILPLEAHISGIRGVPYELNINQDSK